MERIINIISDRFDIDKKSINADTSFDEINADSIDLVDLVMEIEDDFSIEIKDEDFETIKTIGDLVDLIDSL